MNNRYLFLSFTLITSNYLLGNIADLEKQITQTIIRHDANITNLAAFNVIHNPEHLITWTRAAACAHQFNSDFDKKMLRKYSKTIDADKLKKEVCEELKGATRSELLTAYIDNETKAVALKKELLKQYRSYNRNVNSACALLAALASTAACVYAYNMPDAEDTLTLELIRKFQHA